MENCAGSAIVVGVEELNPYASPKSDPIVAKDFSNGPFGHLDFKGVQRLRNHSHSIRAIGLIGFLGFVIVALLAVGGRVSEMSIVIGVLCGLGTFASWWRPMWGQVGGIIFCVMLLLGFPIGTVIGIFGIVAFAQSESVFGPERFRHRAIELEWRERRRER